MAVTSFVTEIFSAVEILMRCFKSFFWYARGDMLANCTVLFYSVLHE
jgi:hypothetical protein